MNRTDAEKYNDLERRKGEALQRRDFNEYDRLDAEQMTFGKFTPIMAHSPSEGSGIVYFHGQILADWNTVAEIAEKFFPHVSATTPDD